MSGLEGIWSTDFAMTLCTYHKRFAILLYMNSYEKQLEKTIEIEEEMAPEFTVDTPGAAKDPETPKPLSFEKKKRFFRRGPTTKKEKIILKFQI